MLLNGANAGARKALAARGRQSCRSVICMSHGNHIEVPEAIAHARAVPATTSTLCTVAEAAAASSSATAAAPEINLAAVAAGGLLLAAYGLKTLYDTPSRTYDANVGDEYDAWTEEGILEYYWGEHIHLGYYTEEERQAGWWKADFKAAKLRFTEEMFKWSGSQAPKRILDVGCGFGGSSRWLAAQNPEAQVTGELVKGRSWDACCRASRLNAHPGWLLVQ